MIDNYNGTVVEGSASLESSVANVEIIPLNTRYTDFNFMNDQICHVKVNNGNYQYLRANQGIELYVVSSFKIQENNVTYNWCGTKL